MVRTLICVGALASILLFVAYIFFSEQAPVAGERISGTELNNQKKVCTEIIRRKGSQEAYQLFLTQAPQNTEIDTHTHAHLFGEALYETDGLEGISICDDSFAFGCYHSFLGSAIYHEGIETLPLFDKACTDIYGSKNLPCQHGIGHGVLVYTGYDDLVGALDLCRIISERPTGGCSSGIFMEYNFHTMESSRGADYLRPLTENPYAPCDSLPDLYQSSCYYEQIHWWLNVYSGDVQTIALLCTELAPESDIRTACFNGIGHYVTANADYNYDTIVSTCSLMPDEQTRGLCHEGASWLMISKTEHTEEAYQLCDVLPEPYTTSCLKKLN